MGLRPLWDAAQFPQEAARSRSATKYPRLPANPQGQSHARKNDHFHQAATGSLRQVNGVVGSADAMVEELRKSDAERKLVVERPIGAAPA